MSSAAGRPDPAEQPAGLVDWRLAARIGARVAGEGPRAGRAEVDEVVTDLRRAAERSTGLVAGVTGLHAPAGVAPVLVVDRAGWVQANTDAFARIMDPVAARLLARRGSGTPTGAVRAVGSAVTGTEVGLMLGYLGTKVLGQFDPFHEPAGRLLLVAPNIVHIGREIGADPVDFRLWVCLHEETHRVQFTAVPWLRDHLFAQVDELTTTLAPGREDTDDADGSPLDDLVARLGDAVRALVGRDGGGTDAGAAPGSLLDLLGSPEQRALVDRVTGMMSLLEGHADVVMDDVGPSVIPSVAAIREAFTRRRGGLGPLDRLVRRLMGLDAKMAQYRDGAAFVRAVVDRVGMADFNAVWTSPQTLPSTAEIKDPDAWVRRVLS